MRATEEMRAMRGTAAWALGQIGDGMAFRPLVSALSDPYAPVRQAAAKALAKLGDPNAIGYLQAVSSDEAEFVRRSAVEAIAQLQRADEREAVRSAIEAAMMQLKRSAPPRMSAEAAISMWFRTALELTSGLTYQLLVVGTLPFLDKTEPSRLTRSARH